MRRASFRGGFTPTILERRPVRRNRVVFAIPVAGRVEIFAELLHGLSYEPGLPGESAVRFVLSISLRSKRSASSSRIAAQPRPDRIFTMTAAPTFVPRIEQGFGS
jgi:hypothetical protein